MPCRAVPRRGVVWRRSIRALTTAWLAACVDAIHTPQPLATGMTRIQTIFPPDNKGKAMTLLYYPLQPLYTPPPIDLDDHQPCNQDNP